MNGKISYKRKLNGSGDWEETPVYTIDGKEVSEAEFREAFPPQQPSGGPLSLVSFKPMESDALAVHSSQVEEAREHARKLGVPTEYKSNGRPVIRSSKHFRSLARALGFRHKGY